MVYGMQSTVGPTSYFDPIYANLIYLHFLHSSIPFLSIYVKMPFKCCNST